MIAFKWKSDIGDQINKAIKKIAEANNLTGVIDIVDFNNEEKLGK
jgi:type I restriction enzyme M protein